MTRLSREPSSVTLNTPNPESGETKILRLTFTLNDSNLIDDHPDDARVIDNDVFAEIAGLLLFVMDHGHRIGPLATVSATLKK